MLNNNHRGIDMGRADLVVYVFGLLASSIVFVGGCVGLALKIQRHITKEFADHRRMMYAMFLERDRAIRSLQFWAIRQAGKGKNTVGAEGIDPYQPAVEPLELLSADKLKKNGSH